MSDSDFDSGDPWDLGPLSPEPAATEDATTPDTDGAAPPPPPATPPAAPEPVETAVDVAETDADVDAPEIEIPEIGDLGVDVPDIDVPDEGDLDAALADLEADAAGDVPDITELDFSELASDVEVETITAEAADVADLSDTASDIDLGSLDDPIDTEVELPEAPGPDVVSGRGPLSAMLASTGLFGDDEAESAIETEPTVDEAIDGADDELETAEDAPDTDAPELEIISDVPELEPPADGTAWVGADSELPESGPDWLEDEPDTGTTEPPSVYKELEDLDGMHEADGETTDPDTPDADFGITFGEEHTEVTEDDPLDDDISRVTSLVADVEPIVIDGDGGEDSAAASPADLDWLGDDDDFSIGVDDDTDLDDSEGGEASVSTDLASDLDSEFSVPEVRFDDDALDVDEDVTTLDDSLPGSEAPDDEADASADAERSDDTPWAPGIASAGAATIPMVADPFTDDGSTDEPSGGEDTDPLGAEEESPEPSESPVDFEDDDLVEVLEEDEPTVDDEAVDHEDEGSVPVAAPVADWGSKWEESQQGWVDGEWRPIIATSDSLSAWAVDVYLGVVVGDVVAAESDVEALASARAEAEERMVSEATSRGAHAVLGVRSTVEQVGDDRLVTSSGTAVTLVALNGNS